MTCLCAARGGHLEVLNWARANDCPWNPGLCKKAADAGLRGFIVCSETFPIHIPKISKAAHKAITEWIAGNQA